MDSILDSISLYDIIALTMYGESRGELIEGQVAVGCVIRNRFLTGRYKNYKAVCLAPEQFSCWNISDNNYSLLLSIADKIIDGDAIEDVYFKQCRFLAIGIVNSNILDNTNGAINYLTKDLWSNNTPNWAKQARNVITIGKQVFFTA